MPREPVDQALAQTCRREAAAGEIEVVFEKREGCLSDEDGGDLYGCYFPGSH